MSEAIKTQILLNKDWDLAYFLEAAETEMASFGASQVLDFSRFFDLEGIQSPRNIMDIFKSIVPKISIVQRIVHRNFRAEPQFLLTGLRTGSILQSMQTWITNIPSMTQGEAGWATASGSFMKQTVLTSPAIKDNKIYAVYKAPNDNLSRAVLIDFIYKPLYIIEEITNSMKRTFVKSRTTMELCATHAIGVITINGMDDFLGPEMQLPNP